MLTRELETYCRELPNLMEHEGKYVLIHEDQVAGLWELEEEAVRAGEERYGRDAFLVKEIRQTDRCCNSPAANATENGAAQLGFPPLGTEAWGQMNRRRAELIRKKIRGELTTEEREEYDLLQRCSLEALEQAYPRPGDEGHRCQETLSQEGTPGG